MCLLLETILLQDGRAEGLPYHNRRANRARRELFGADRDIDLGEYLSPAAAGPGRVKGRVLYERVVERVEYHPYQPPVIRSLRLVADDDIDYRHKYADRSALERLRGRRGECDDVLIVRRGLLTDVSFANVVFSDGRRLVTPARPLLEGTRRAALLDGGKIEAADVRPADLAGFDRVILVNSLIGLEDDVSVPVGLIRRD